LLLISGPMSWCNWCSLQPYEDRTTVWCKHKYVDFSRVRKGCVYLQLAATFQNFLIMSRLSG